MKIYVTSAQNVHSLLDGLLKEICGGYELLKNEFGKPYVRGNPVYFNISHSGDFGCVALSDSPVGIDIETFRGKDRNRLISAMTLKERQKIKGESDFLKHFTAREAYIKYKGLSIFTYYKRLDFIDGAIYLDGEKQAEPIRAFTFKNFVLSVCGEGEIQFFDTQSG